MLVQASIPPARVRTHGEREWRYRAASGRGLPSVTEILRDLRASGEEPSSWLRARQVEGLWRGSFLNRYAAQTLRSGELRAEEEPWQQLLAEGDRLAGYCVGWRRWFSEVRPRAILVEHPMVEEDFPAHGGTLDLLAVLEGLGGKPALVDFKCLAAAPKKVVALQTAGYQRLVSRCVEDPEVRAIAAAAERQTVWLRQDGRYKVVPHQRAYDSRVFLSMAETWWWLHENAGLFRAKEEVAA